jgi:acyl-coenzyme A thioesterase PaaI-like protein
VAGGGGVLAAAADYRMGLNAFERSGVGRGGGMQRDDSSRSSSGATSASMD